MEVDEVGGRRFDLPGQSPDGDQVERAAHRHRADCDGAALRLGLGTTPGRAEQPVVVSARRQTLDEQEDLHLAAGKAALGVDVDDAQRRSPGDAHRSSEGSEGPTLGHWRRSAFTERPVSTPAWFSAPNAVLAPEPGTPPGEPPAPYADHPAFALRDHRARAGSA